MVILWAGARGGGVGGLLMKPWWAVDGWVRVVVSCVVCQEIGENMTGAEKMKTGD